MWVSTQEAVKALGVSKTYLYQLRKDSLKQGIHYRDIRSKNSLRATYKWNIKKIETLLNLGAEKRC